MWWRREIEIWPWFGSASHFGISDCCLCHPWIRLNLWRKQRNHCWWQRWWWRRKLSRWLLSNQRHRLPLRCYCNYHSPDHPSATTGQSLSSSLRTERNSKRTVLRRLCRNDAVFSTKFIKNKIDCPMSKRIVLVQLHRRRVSDQPSLALSLSLSLSLSTSAAYNQRNRALAPLNEFKNP